MTHEQAEAIVRDAAARLSEHFGSVQILASWLLPDGNTDQVKRGSGDWYARQGLAHEFINQDQSSDAARFLAEKLTPPDESDDWKAPTQ